ncbi:MAG: hypothetical protein KAI66_19835 [Lentisphaeria bacterium]|nr:hypothetical protein [Lentisphaeria bacterium]
MSKLAVTLIDVGWGDSIFIEAIDASGQSRYGLIDSNDEGDHNSTLVFLRKFFRLTEKQIKARRPVFDFVMLSHDHSDHGVGLKRILSLFGAEHFWYPKIPEDQAGTLSTLLGYVTSHWGRQRVSRAQAVDSVRDLPGCPALGDVVLDVLWPDEDYYQSDDDPNNNSIVLALTLDQVTFLMTGDAELPVWSRIARKIPASTKVVKLPHHGSVNGTYENDQSPWLDMCDPGRVKLGISCHPTYPRGFPSHPHPHQEVVDELDARGFTYFRTDENYHITFSTDGQNVSVKAARE